MPQYLLGLRDHLAMTAIWDTLLRTVVERTGFSPAQPDVLSVEDAIRHRLKEHPRAATPEAYLDLLMHGDAQDEWNHLAHVITNGESYFFRDSGQMDALRRDILPTLIDRRRSSKTLTLWSAGCSTGEEPYSLAMLISDMLPLSGGWTVRIIGTDLDPSRIQHAREGRYEAWSFRQVDATLRDRWFQAEGSSRWQIRNELRSHTHFDTFNLVSDFLPNPRLGLQDLDLIVCRNVLIYFTTEARKAVVEKLSQSLASDGVLMVGHGEIFDSRPPALKPVTMGGTVVYQLEPTQPTSFELPAPLPMKPIEPTTESVSLTPTTSLPSSAPASPVSTAPATTSPVSWLDFDQALADGRLELAEHSLDALAHDPAATVNDAKIRLGLARLYLRMNAHADSAAFLDGLLHHPEVGRAAHVLSAMIALADQDHDTANSHLRHARYFDASDPAVSILMGDICHDLGDAHESKRAYQRAQHELSRLEPGAVLPGLEQRVATAREYVARLINLST